jgi:hypothetical protein
MAAPTAQVSMNAQSLLWATAGITTQEVSDQLVITHKDDMQDAGFKIGNSID